jgi:hypothetical protein
VGILGVGLATAASAASAPAGPSTLTFADPKGDNVSPGAGSDIAGVTFTTTGTGSGKSYAPKNLVITLSLAGPPTTDGTTIYQVGADLAGCGDFYVSIVPGSPVLDPSFNYADCGSPADELGSEGTAFDAVPDIAGNNIVWTLPMKSLPAPVVRGTVFSALNAYTDFVDPVTGIFGPKAVTEEALYDVAATDQAYKVG